jgi:hypothetical protein
VLRTDDGKTLRIISREPTPWTNLRLGTTFTGLKVDWDKKPRVQVIGVAAIDRMPEEFYDVKLDQDQTVTAFIVRVEYEEGGKKVWRDFFINNWFHRWGKDADAKVLPHYARKEPRYGIYGYVSGHYAPLDKASKKLLEKYEPEYSGIIYHALLVKADNPIGYELKVLHLMGRHKKTAEYRVFHGNAKELIRLDDRPPKK